jgi:uncharacterized protein HemX
MVAPPFVGPGGRQLRIGIYVTRKVDLFGQQQQQKQQQQPTNNKQQTTNNKQQTANSKQQTANSSSSSSSSQAHGHGSIVGLFEWDHKITSTFQAFCCQETDGF